MLKLITSLIEPVKKTLDSYCKVKWTTNISAFQINNNQLYASDLGLNKNYSYFLFHASYGDKWLILSFMSEFLHIYQDVRILARIEDRELIRIFIGESEVLRAVVFLENEELTNISNTFNPLSISSNYLWSNDANLVQSNRIISEGFPKNAIRHLHIVKYPYFSDLHLAYGVSYAALVKMVLCLPSVSKGKFPEFYNNDDRFFVQNFRKFISDEAEAVVLFNVVNFSHKSFTHSQVDYIISQFESRNIQVLINVTQLTDLGDYEEIVKNSSCSKIVQIPGHLLALICDEVDGVLGIIGGAMNVAVQFSRAHCYSLYADATGYNLNLSKFYGGYYRDNIWRLWDQDWPCLSPGRFVVNFDAGDPSLLDDAYFSQLVSNFSKNLIKNKL